MKAFLGMMIAAQLLMAPVAPLETVTYEDPEVVTEELRDGDPMRPEEFMWFYRFYNGVQQKRLWSITYMRWVTDWIDCE